MDHFVRLGEGFMQPVPGRYQMFGGAHAHVIRGALPTVKTFLTNFCENELQGELGCD